MTTVENLTEEEKRLLLLLKDDASIFAKYVLNMDPFEYQRRFLTDKSKRIVICSGRQIGKSYMTSAKALWFAISHPRSLTLIVSAALRQSMGMFDTIMGFVYGSNLLSNSVRNFTRTKILFTNGAQIVALPCGPMGKTIRGLHADLIIVDEAAFVPEEVISGVILPMLATTDGTVIMLSTPWDRDHAFYKAFTNPYWTKYHFPSSINPIIKPEFLEEMRQFGGELKFRREYLAEFIDDQDSYFPMTLIRPCVHVCKSMTSCEFCRVWSDSGATINKGLLYGGYDPGGKVDPAGFIIVDIPRGTPRERARIRCLLAKNFKSKDRGAQDDNLYSRFTTMISELHKSGRWRMEKLLVDSQGIGAPIIEHCRTLGLPVEGMPMTLQNKEIIFSHLRLKMEQRLLELPNDSEVLSNLNSIDAKMMANGNYQFSHQRTTQDDFAYALALGVYAATSKAAPTIIMSKW